MIATPAYGEVFYAPYVHSVLALSKVAHRDKWEVTFETISYAEVSEARNYLLTRFFDKTDATHLLFIDADMGFPAKLVPEHQSQNGKDPYGQDRGRQRKNSRSKADQRDRHQDRHHPFEAQGKVHAPLIVRPCRIPTAMASRGLTD